MARKDIFDHLIDSIVTLINSLVWNSWIQLWMAVVFVYHELVYGLLWFVFVWTGQETRGAPTQVRPPPPGAVGEGAPGACASRSRGARESCSPAKRERQCVRFRARWIRSFRCFWWNGRNGRWYARYGRDGRDGWRQQSWRYGWDGRRTWRNGFWVPFEWSWSSCCFPGIWICTFLLADHNAISFFPVLEQRSLSYTSYDAILYN